MAVRLGVLALLLGLAMPASAQETAPPAPSATMPARGETPPVDYGADAGWLCRPGKSDPTCSADLDAMAISADAKRTPVPFVAAKDAPIDCFYVYPTASQDPTLYSDLVPDEGERRAVHGQAARLSARCRLFVPMYHQLTYAALRWTMAGGGEFDTDIPYRDVLAAWRDYLAHDNQGRGVVLIGHSQGAIILKRLIAEEVDGKPAQKRLVAAYLAGNLDLSATSFKHIPACRAADQSGCLVAWSSYLETQTGPRVFGGTAKGETPICVNPAAIGGGRGALKAFLNRPAMASPNDPPWIELTGQLTAECVTDEKGAVLRVRIEPGPLAGLLQLGLGRYGTRTSWGVHPIDINLVEGNLLDLMASQSAAYLKAR